MCQVSFGIVKFDEVGGSPSDVIFVIESFREEIFNAAMALVESLFSKFRHVGFR